MDIPVNIKAKIASLTPACAGANVSKWMDALASAMLINHLRFPLEESEKIFTMSSALSFLLSASSRRTTQGTVKNDVLASVLGVRRHQGEAMKLTLNRALRPCGAGKQTGHACL